MYVLIDKLLVLQHLHIGHISKVVKPVIVVYMLIPDSSSRSDDTHYENMPMQYSAFSDILGKFLVPMKLEKNCVILGKMQRFWEKKWNF